MINIGDRVAYDDEASVALPDECGTVVEPTPEEEAGFDPDHPAYSVMVAWGDGARSWEDPDGLVVVRGAGS